MGEAFICDAIRTPIGRYGGALTAVHHLEKAGGRLALATMCIGVGQGIAMAMERV